MSVGPHLVLIGLMGAGKTSVGEQCARRLGRRFLDTDAVIELATDSTVAELFATGGEPAFRARERAVVADVAAAPDPLVVACGGGVAIDPDNRRTLRACGFVVWLQASPSVLASRVELEGVARRPLLAGGPTAATLVRLADARADAYAAASHVTISTEGKAVDAVTEAVLEAFATAGEPV